MDTLALLRKLSEADGISDYEDGVRSVVRLFSLSAEENGIPYQFVRGVIGGTDSGALHLAREGVPAGVLAVPCRYVHAPVGVVSLVDYENMVRLVMAALDRLGGGLVAGKS